MLVTSGGMYVRDEKLFVILANCRSMPQDVQEYTFAMELDAPHRPLVPISLNDQFHVGFTPSDAAIPDVTVPNKVFCRMRGIEVRWMAENGL